ncbi:hypothetical protein [Citrobacter portucalensis]|uniref:hypothetical protein n=1 Tax=Citrobacter portucalensis TaxID=1639133 RepID=UPI0024DEF53A|nr:hypothetical protein [Citrobacter portucalensis]MDK2579421.1 hypothetical protein [Citrobacter portucalensis]
MSSREKFEAWCINRLISVTSMVGCDSYQSWRTRELWASWQAAELASEQKLTDMAVQLANAESKCREMVAELSAVDKIHNEAVFITDENYEQSPPEVQKMIRSLAVLQIPDYDTFLAEVRASCVESAINTVIAMMNHQHPVTSKAIDILRVHAAQLRKGAAL